MVKITNKRKTIADYPKLLAEWHPTKNGDLRPDEVYASSKEEIWWKCSDGHEWKMKINSRTIRKSSCPFCSSLTKLFPEVAKQWHPTKNGDLKPDEIYGRSKEKVWWKCPIADDHEWEIKVISKVSNETNCPFCTIGGKKVSKTNSLSAKFPKIAKEWHPTKNGNLKPDKVKYGSRKKVWWICEEGIDHIWKAMICNRTTANGTNCPYCNGKKVSITNSLAFLFPEIAKEWHPTKNKKLRPDQATAHSSKERWWKCSKGDDHEWKARIYTRTTNKTDCQFCSGKKVSKTNSLAKLFPEIAKEWHPTKNGNLSPTQMTSKSDKERWWKCSKGDDHEWKATIKNRTRENKTNCPECAKKIIGEKIRKRAAKEHNFALLYPEIAKEWHSTKNEDKKPECYGYGSNEPIWWQCLDCKHEWKAKINSRTTGKTNCPICNDLTNMYEKWHGWQELCENIVQCLYPKSFKIQPKLPKKKSDLQHKRPDMQYKENNLTFIADAKLHSYIPQIEESITNYLPHCNRLEFWCLDKERKTEIRDNKEIRFINADTLLQGIKDPELYKTYKTEVERLRNWKPKPQQNNVQNNTS